MDCAREWHPRAAWSPLGVRITRSRARRRIREPPSDAEIERGLREKAVTDPRAAEILLRWLQRPRQDNPPGVDLDAMSEAQLERLHAGLVQLASLDNPSSRRWSAGAGR